MALILPTLSTFFAISCGLLPARTVSCCGVPGPRLVAGPRLGQLLAQHEAPLALAVLDVGADLALRAADIRATPTAAWDGGIAVSGIGICRCGGRRGRGRVFGRLVICGPGAQGRYHGGQQQCSQRRPETCRLSAAQGSGMAAHVTLAIRRHPGASHRLPCGGRRVCRMDDGPGHRIGWQVHDGRAGRYKDGPTFGPVCQHT